MKGKSVRHKLVLLPASFVLFVQSFGCVSIRHTAPPHTKTIANCSNIQTQPSLTQESCELVDRRAVIQQWVSKLNPRCHVPPRVVGWVGNCKERSALWITNQYGRCSTVKASIQGWIQEKKDEANAAPWPRFHPVPTQNVFEPQEAVSPAPATPAPATVPEVYGRFGKG